MASLAERPMPIHDERRSRVQAVLLAWCEPKVQYDGMTAWEVAGKILAVLDDPTEPAQFERTMDARGFTVSQPELAEEAQS